MHDEYYRITAKIKEAREEGNAKKLKTWRGKLTKWQQAYGAYAPIK